MKSNHSEIAALVAEDQLGYSILAELSFNSTYYFTTHDSNVVWNGNTYQRQNFMLEFEPPRYSTTVDREAYTLKLSGVSQTFINEVQAGIVNSPVTLRLAFVTDRTVANGLDETIHIYSGTVSSARIDTTTDERAVVIECSAPLSNLDATGTMFTTKDGMSVFNADDTSFDQILEGSDGVELKWGRV